MNESTTGSGTQDPYEVDSAGQLINSDHVFCRQIDGECVGYHCSTCGAAVGQQGHDCPDDSGAVRVTKDGRIVGHVISVKNGYDGTYVTLKLNHHKLIEEVQIT